MFRTVMQRTLISSDGCRNNNRVARLAAAAAIGAVLFTGPASASDYRCAKDPHVIGECFTVHGRLSRYANSRIKLWRIGSSRVLGVQYPGNMPEVGGDFVDLPDNVEKAWQGPWDYIFADFRVCPFTKSEPGIQQYVCIDSAEHIVVQKACTDYEGHIKRACS